jgi:hypothetical protein
MGSDRELKLKMNESSTSKSPWTTCLADLMRIWFSGYTISHLLRFTITIQLMGGLSSVTKESNRVNYRYQELGSHIPLQSLQSCNNYHVVIFLLQTAYYHNSNDAFNTLNPNRNSSSVNSVRDGILSQHELVFKLLFVAFHLDVHEPATASPSQYRCSLAGNPEIIVGSGTRARSCVKEQLIAVC